MMDSVWMTAFHSIYAAFANFFVLPYGAAWTRIYLLLIETYVSSRNETMTMGAAWIFLTPLSESCLVTVSKRARSFVLCPINNSCSRYDRRRPRKALNKNIYITHFCVTSRTWSLMQITIHQVGNSTHPKHSSSLVLRRSDQTSSSCQGPDQDYRLDTMNKP